MGFCWPRAQLHYNGPQRKIPNCKTKAVLNAAIDVINDATNTAAAQKPHVTPPQRTFHAPYNQFSGINFEIINDIVFDMSVRAMIIPANFLGW